MSRSPFCSNPVFSHLEYTCQEQTKRTPREGLLIVFPGVIQKVYENIGFSRGNGSSAKRVAHAARTHS